MQELFQHLRLTCEQAVASAVDSAALDLLRVRFLGRKGEMATLMKKLGEQSEDDRQRFGAMANETKQALEQLFVNAQSIFEQKANEQRAFTEWLDMSEPGLTSSEGHLHPVSQAIAEITDLFSRMGFSRVSAPEIDWDWYVFESLNMPADHPARDNWETFFVDAPAGDRGRLVLTPHTSNAQVREMEKGRLPIRIININRCYRRQSDVNHIPMFHQFEGLMVDEGIAITHLKGVLDAFARSYFGPTRLTRLRPHHFRFTEPSFEIDISCGVCDGTGKTKEGACRLCKSGWLELGGAGMTHPAVLKAGGLDPDRYTAFAFGWGVERTMMMREGMKIDDIRLLYRNDLRFAEQF